MNKVDEIIMDRMVSEDRWSGYCRSLMNQIKRLETILQTSTDEQKRDSAKTQLMILRNWAYNEQNPIYPKHIIKDIDGLRIIN